MFASSATTSFSRKAASLPSLLLYLTEDLSLVGLFNRNVSLTAKFAMVKVSENAVEEEPLSQTRVDMINAKNKTLVKKVTVEG